MGLGIELNRLGDQTVKLGFDELGIGVGLLLVWATTFYFFPIWWVNLLTLPLLFMSLYGIIKGVLKVFRNLFLSKKIFLVKLPIVLAQFAAFVAAIFTTLNILKII